MLSITVAALVINNASASAVYVGKYIIGFESSDFIPCGTSEHWWLEGPAEQKITESLASKKEEHFLSYEPIYIKVTGSLSKPGKWGHMGAYNRKIIATQLHTIGPELAAECHS